MTLPPQMWSAVASGGRPFVSVSNAAGGPVRGGMRIVRRGIRIARGGRSAVEEIAGLAGPGAA